MSEGESLPVERVKNAPFLPGKSGNPGGRPKGSKNAVTKLKNSLEKTVREAINPEDVVRVWQEVVSAALEGSRPAQKMVLDYALSKPREKDDKDKGGVSEYRFLVVHATPEDIGESRPVEGEIYDQE